MKPPIPINITWGYRELMANTTHAETVVLLRAHAPNTTAAKAFVHGIFHRVESQDLFLDWHATPDKWWIRTKKAKNREYGATIAHCKINTKTALTQVRESVKLKQVNSLWALGCRFLLYFSTIAQGFWFSKNYIQVSDSPDLPQIIRLLYVQTTPDYQSLAIWNRSS